MAEIERAILGGQKGHQLPGAGDQGSGAVFETPELHETRSGRRGGDVEKQVIPSTETG